MRTPEERSEIIERIGSAVARALSGNTETWTFRLVAPGEGRWHRLDDGLSLRVTAGWATFAERVEVAPETLPIGSELAAPSRFRIHVTHRHTLPDLAAEVRARLILPYEPHFRRQRAVLRAGRYSMRGKAAALGFIEEVFGTAVPAGQSAITVAIGGVVMPLRAEEDGRVLLGGSPIEPHALAIMAHRLQNGGGAAVS